jgi:hypothetical protein
LKRQLILISGEGREDKNSPSDAKIVQKNRYPSCSKTAVPSLANLLPKVLAVYLSLFWPKLAQLRTKHSMKRGSPTQFLT